MSHFTNPPRRVVFYPEDELLQQAPEAVAEAICGGAEELAQDRARGTLTDVWGCDPDILRLDGHRIVFIASRQGEDLYVITPGDFTGREQQVLRAYFLDQGSPMIGESFTGGWDAFNEVTAAVAYRGGRGYQFALTEVHPDRIPYAPSKAEALALRAKTGHGAMDCKKALLEANGDEERARDFLVKMTRHRL